VRAPDQVIPEPQDFLGDAIKKSGYLLGGLRAIPLESLPGDGRRLINLRLGGLIKQGRQSLPAGRGRGCKRCRSRSRRLVPNDVLAVQLHPPFWPVSAGFNSKKIRTAARPSPVRQCVNRFPLRSYGCRFTVQDIRMSPAPTYGILIWHEKKNTALQETCKTGDY
jgi:hypothetical protein